MSDYVVGSAAVVIKPIFTGFQKAIQNEFRSALSTEATKAGTAAGEDMADAVGKQGKEAGEKFTDEVAKGTKGQGRKTTKAAENIAKGMDKPFETAGKKSGNKFADGLKKAMGPIAGIIAGISVADQIGDTITKSSNAEQSLGATEAIFKQHSDKVVKMSEEAAEKYGLSGNTYRESSNLLGALFKNQGVELDQLAGKTDQMVGIGADLAAQFGGTTAESVEALSAAFKGEYDSLDKYGITMNESIVKDELKRLGQDKLTGTALALATQEAKTNLIMKSSADAAGAAAREADTFAGAQARLTAKVDNLKAQIGKPLTDALAASFGFISDTALPALTNFGGWIDRNKVSIGLLAGVLGAMTIAINASTIATGVANTATKIWAGTMRVLNMVMNMNPIMKVVAVIGVLVAGVVYAYNNFKTFRTIVDGAWTGIKNATGVAWAFLKGVFNGVVGFIQKNLIPAFQDFPKKVSQAFTWLLNNVIKPVWSGIRVAIKVAVDLIKGYINGWIWVFKNVLAPAVKWVYESVIKPVWNGIKTAIKFVIDAVKGYIGIWVNLFKYVLAPAFRTLRDTISTVWNNIKTTISDVWNNKIKPIFQALGSFITKTVVPAFEKGVKSIKDIWNGIRNAAAKPINFVIESVYNEGLLPAINKVRGVVGGDPLPRLSAIPAFAKGGRAKKGWKLVGEEGPELINTGPGYVYTAKETKAMLEAKTQAPMGALGALDGSNGGQPKLPIGGWFSDIVNGAKNALGGAVDWMRGGMANLAGLILNPIKSGINNLITGPSAMADIARRASSQVIDKALSWISGKDAEGMTNNAGPMMAGGWYRPSNGPITSRFGASRGAYPHAGIDIAGGGPTFAARNGIVAKTGFSNVLTGRTGMGILINHGGGLQTYYGHNPMNGVKVKAGQQVKGGQHIGYQGNTGNSTGTHLHFETLRNGRPVNPEHTGLFDNGGWLNPGLTAAMNKTGKPEAILTSEQWKSISSIAVRESANASTQINVTVPKPSASAMDIADEIYYQNKKMQRGGRR